MGITIAFVLLLAAVYVAFLRYEPAVLVLQDMDYYSGDFSKFQKQLSAQRVLCAVISAFACTYLALEFTNEIFLPWVPISVLNFIVLFIFTLLFTFILIFIIHLLSRFYNRLLLGR